MAAKKGSKETKLISRILKAPIRVLIKARDFYVQSMLECSGRAEYGMVLGCSTGPVYPLSKSFSVNSSNSSNVDKDFRELVRAASTRSLENKVESDLVQRLPKASVKKVVPRSQSVGIGRIDEEKICEFEGEVEVRIDHHMFSRSRSCDVSKKRAM